MVLMFILILLDLLVPLDLVVDNLVLVLLLCVLGVPVMI